MLNDFMFNSEIGLIRSKVIKNKKKKLASCLCLYKNDIACIISTSYPPITTSYSSTFALLTVDILYF